MTFGLLMLVGVAQTGGEALLSGYVRSVPRSSRWAVHMDPVEASLVRGTWSPLAVGSAPWRPLAANKDGWFEDDALGGGYVYATLNSPARRIALLEAEGASLAYVNGTPRAGDPYGFGYVSLPVQLKAGRNEFLFLVGRGRVRAKVVEPTHAISWDTRDATTPDVATANGATSYGGFIVRNATEQWVTGLTVQATSGRKVQVTKLPPIGPLTNRKVPVLLPLATEGKVSLRLVKGGKLLDESSVTLRVRKDGEPYKSTFISQIDGSVQYYGVNPSSKPGAGQALFLSLHGASVEGIGQAEAYGQKDWGTLVAPTNRRPYGFDWEDIGRRDALEVLALGKSRFKTDPLKTYLTGHSMGGHGTWQIGTTFPGLFSAIAPSAGWISFTTYAGGVKPTNPSPVEQILVRAGTPSETFGLRTNLNASGVYIVHGDADDNVPVTEARTMRDGLKGIVTDFGYHEEPGAGHWWDNSDAPGAACVDYPGVFDMFKRRQLLPISQVKSVDFTTGSPGISAGRDWLTIEQQIVPLALSRAQVKVGEDGASFVGTTENVATLTLDPAPLGGTGHITLILDGQTLPLPRRKFTVRKVGKQWELVRGVQASEKSPSRNGGFKDIFRNRVVFVYATHGAAEENAWAYAKARYDAETLWVRGNGAVDVVADRDFNPRRASDRNVLLYGSAVSNSVYNALVGKSPVTFGEGSVTVGDRVISAPDLAVLFIRPRVGSKSASVAVIGGTGPVGRRVSERVPIFLSGAALPDLFVVGADSLEKGAAGVRAAGFFGNDWSVKSGDFAFGPTR